MAHNSALAQLGMHSASEPRTIHDSVGDVQNPRWQVVDGDKDYFVERNGLKFAGTHLLIDLWEASNLDNLEIVERALVESAEVAGATILHTHLHHFSPNGGISGVIVLAESHISIHTWPERGYAALDVFMCGACDPYKAVPILRREFKAGFVQLNEQKRGLVP